MAARKDPKHDARTRQKIQTSQLINRLTDFVNSKVELNPAQVTAALGLLKKSLPDLSNVEMQALDENGDKSAGFKITVEHVSK